MNGFVARHKVVALSLMAILVFVLTACIPGITTANGVEAYIERVNADTVQAELILPAPATNVLVEFESIERTWQYTYEEKEAGSHIFVVAGEGANRAISCFTSGYLNGETYFLLPCEAR